MGLFIHLIVNPNGLDPEAWERTYQESCLLLQKFPVQLRRLAVEKIKEQKRLVFTPAIIANKDTKEEAWDISGDLISGQGAESFELPRYLDQLPTYNASNKDVLWSPKDSYGIDGNGINLFGNKTQGCPYHLAVLAVGILVENRFPNHSYVVGNFDQTQVDGVTPWMNTFLAHPVKQPITLDGARLYKRLKTLYDDPRLAIKRFKTLSLESDEQKLATLLRHGDKKEVLQEFSKELQVYSSLSQWGAIRLIEQFLCTTQDLQQLIEIVIASRKSNPQFDLEELLRVLGDQFVTIDKEKRAPLHLFTQQVETMPTIEDTFTKIFLKLGRAPSAIDFYMDRTALLATFTQFEPTKRSAFETILTECEKECQKQLEDTKKLIRSLEEKSPVTQPPEKLQAIDHEPNSALVEEYILNQAYRQKEVYPAAEEMAKEAGNALQKIIQKSPQSFHSTDRQFYLERIYKVSFEHSIILETSVWAKIDQEQNLAILKALLVFLAIKNNELNFWNCRRYLIQNTHLWPYLIGDHPASKKSSQET